MKTFKFKRSKKLERALRCMRESHMDHDSLHLSAMSTTTSMLSDASSETTSVDDMHHALILSQEIKQRTRRDPEPITKRDIAVMKSARSRGGGDILNSQSSTHEMSNKKKDAPMILLKLAKKQGVQRIDIAGATRKEAMRTKKAAAVNNIRSTAADLRKELDTYISRRNHSTKGKGIEDIATRPKKFEIKEAFKEGTKGVKETSKGNAKTPRVLDEYQRELIRTIEEFEARKIQRLQKLGYDVNEATAKVDEDFLEDFLEDECSSQSSDEEATDQAAAPEDRNDTPPSRVPPIFSSSPKDHRRSNSTGTTSLFKLSSAMAISSQIPPPVPQREETPMVKQPAKSSNNSNNNNNNRKTLKQKDAIVSHIASVANHLVQTQQLFASSGDNTDLNRRMLRDNTSELLRNLAIIQGVEQPGDGSNFGKRMKPVSRMMNHEPRATKPSFPDPRSAANNNIRLLRAKRDEAAMAVRKETQKLSASLLENPTVTIPRAKEADVGNGKRRNKERYNPREREGLPANDAQRGVPRYHILDEGKRRNKERNRRSSSYDAREKQRIPAKDERRVSQHHRHEDDHAEFDRHDDRADRLDRVKDMIEELRYLRSAKFGNNE